MKGVSLKRVVCGLIFFSLGVLLWATNEGFASGAGHLMFIGSLILMPHKEFTEPVPGKQLVLGIAGFLVLIGIIKFARSNISAEDQAALSRITSHPALLFVLWVACVASVLRRWSKDNAMPAEAECA